MENLGISKTPDGWYLVDTGVKCFASTGCDAAGKHYDRGAVLEVQKCGKYLSPDVIDGFVCDRDTIWRCDAAACNCMGQTIAHGTACTQDGPYTCSTMVKGADCRDGNLYCSNDIAPKDVELYECSIDKYWICQADECPCGDAVAYKGDYCIDQTIIDICENGSESYRNLDPCEGYVNQLCLQRQAYKDGFGEFDAYAWTSGCSGCGAVYGNLCTKTEGCYSERRHYSYLAWANESNFHYDRLEDAEGDRNSDGFCVLDHAETDRNHATVPVVDAESGAPLEWDYDNLQSNSYILEVESEKLKARGVEVEDIKEILIYDASKCVGGTIWCQSRMSLTRKPVDGRGYLCTDFNAKERSRTWVCTTEEECQCGGQSCIMGYACIDEQCVAPIQASNCRRDGTAVDGKCLCNGKEAPSKDYQCASGHWVCSVSQCACGEKTCPQRTVCDNGRCLCGDQEVPQEIYGTDFICSEGKWRCDSRNGCHIGKLECPRWSYYEDGRCLCGNAGESPAPDTDDYACEEGQWICQKESCACGSRQCPRGTAYINNEQNSGDSGEVANAQNSGDAGDVANEQNSGDSGEVANEQNSEDSPDVANEQNSGDSSEVANEQIVCGEDRIVSPSVLDGYECTTPFIFGYVPYETWICRNEEGCICGGKSCPEGSACINETCSCYSPIVSNGQSHYQPLPEEGDGYRCMVTMLPHDASMNEYYSNSTTSWVCKQERGCQCGSIFCPEFAQCVNGECECDGRKLDPGYTCNDFELVSFDDRYETNGTQICDQNQCTCGEDICPRGASCYDDKCYCGNIDYSHANMSQYTCNPENPDNPDVEYRFWTCSDPNGCACGNEKCFGNALCKDEHCVCGSEPNPGTDFTCVTTKYTASWICNNDAGCMIKGKLEPKGTPFAQCEDGTTLGKDGCYCGETRIDDPGLGCCNGHVYAHKDYYCPENGTVPLAITGALRPCGDSLCPPYSACVDSKCQNPFTGAPVTRDGDYLVDGFARICAEKECTCGNEKVRMRQLCQFGADGTDFSFYEDVGVFAIEGRYVRFYDINLTELKHTKIALTDPMIDNKTLNMQSYMVDTVLHAPLCLNPNGCVCGSRTCMQGSICNTELGECFFPEVYPQIACGASKQNASNDEPQVPSAPSITADDNGMCICQGTVRMPNVLGYQCTELGWLCDAAEGCACGKAICKKDGICVKPDVCVE